MRMGITIYCSYYLFFASFVIENENVQDTHAKGVQQCGWKKKQIREDYRDSRLFFSEKLRVVEYHFVFQVLPTSRAKWIAKAIIYIA